MTAGILGIISYLFMTAFVCISFYFLSVMRRDIRRIRSMMIHMNATVFGIKIRQDINSLQEMQQHLKQCADEEDYENAEKLKNLIHNQVESIENQVELFRNAFGEFCDIKLEIIKKDSSR